MPKIAILVLLIELQTQITGSFISVNEIINSNVEIIKSLLNINLQGYNLLTIINEESIIYVLKNLLLISSLISLIIGTIVGLAQTKIN